MRISDWSSDVCSSDLGDHDLRRVERSAARDHRQDVVGVLSVDLKLSDAEQNLRDDLRGWLDSDYTFAAHLARTATAASRDDARWRTMVDRGWIARALPCRDAKIGREHV